MSLFYLLRREGEAPPGAAHLSPREEERLGPRASPKRRADFALGRFTAREAIGGVLGLPPSDLGRLEVLPHASGAPEAYLDGRPLDLPISISHSSGTAMAVVSRSGPVGADLEVVAPRDPGLLEDFFTSSERLLVNGLPAAERSLVVNLLFSAKESASKLLREGMRLDLRTLEVALAGLAGPSSLWSTGPSVFAADPGPSSRRADRFRPLAVRLPGGPPAPGVSPRGRDLAVLSSCPGWWRREGPFVVTLVSERESEPPVRLAPAAS